MRSAVYLNGSILQTNSRTIAQISMELRQQIQDDFLIYFDDKNLFSGNEELQQVQGKLNIFQSKYILKVSANFERLEREGEIKLNELKALQVRLVKQEELFKNEQKALSDMLKFEIDMLQQQISKFEDKENSYIQKIEHLKKKQLELEFMLGKTNKNVQNNQIIQGSENKEKAQQNVLSQLSCQITELRTKNKQLQIQIENKNQESVIIKNSKQVVDNKHEYLKQQIEQMEQLRNTKDQELQEIQKLNQIELEANKQEYMKIKQELEKKIVEVKQKSIRIQENLNQQVKDCQTLIDKLEIQIQLKDETIKQLEQQISRMKTEGNKQVEINALELQKTNLVSDQQNLVNSQKDYQQNLALNKNILFEIAQEAEVGNQIYDENNAILRFIQDRQLKSLKDFNQNKQQDKERLRIKKEQIEKSKRLNHQLYEIKRSILEEDLRKKCKEISDMQICFLINTTSSMGTYLEQTLNCVSTCNTTIDKKLNRQIRWAIASYKDSGCNETYDYFFGFTKDQIELLNFCKRIKCDGGGDAADNIEGGFNIVLDQDKVKWTQPIKICILITGSPCHGRRFTNRSDNHKDYDMRQKLIKMMQTGITLIGIKLNKSTDLMYSEFQQIYKDQNSEELLHVFDLQNKEVSTLWQDVTIAIAAISERNATQKKNTMNRDINLGTNKVGSTQALIENLKDPTKFEEVSQTKDVILEVIRIELKQEDINTQVREIVNPKIELIQSSSLGTWQCKMSKKPFAKGLNKSVYVMRKQNNQDEVYLLKGLVNGDAYPSLDIANKECFSHLVAQFLMEEFKKCLVKQNINHPQVIYSNILIFKEAKDKYWIAEKYFRGEFEKYNSNYGYINEKITDLNHFAQGYSLFTLQFCEYSQMIVDIQGVGNYWTDPAINTKLGGFDATDMGEDGLSMYLINKDIDTFKGLGLKYKIN